MFKRLQMADGDGSGGGGGAPNPGEGGAPAPSWYGDTHKDYVANKGWKTGDDAIASYQNFEKLLGADKAGRTVVLPKDDKDVDGLKAYRTKLGVPESHTAYPIPEVMKEDPHIGKFAEILHKHNVPTSAFNGVMEWMQAEAKASADADKQADEAAQKQAREQSEKQLTGLKSEWGDKFEQNAEFARRFLKESGWDDARIGKYEETFGTASMLKDFHTWGSKTGEQSYEGGSGSGGFALSKQQAMEKLDSYRAQRADGKINDTRYRELEPELEALRKVAYAA